MIVIARLKPAFKQHTRAESILLLPPTEEIEKLRGDQMSATMLERAEPIRVLGLSGSLRRHSYNRRLLDAARILAPEWMEITSFDLGQIPLYNGDLDNDHDRPTAVMQFKQTVVAADALLIATPEYNHNISGVLQNAIDWASRPATKSPLAGKPTSIMGASTGAIGTARAQQQLKLVLFSTLALVMPHPGVTVGQAAEKFDHAGALVHAPTREFLQTYLRDFGYWILQTGRVRETARTFA